MRLNPPPNWPPPEWSPPPDWTPDPSWPPPPPDWELWVPDDHKPPRSRGALIAGIVAALAIIALVVVLAIDFFPKKESGPSDEEQIRQVMATVADAWNSSDFDKYKGVSCTMDLDDKDFNQANFQKARDKAGTVMITVESVQVTGDTASAKIERKQEKDALSMADEQTFRKEGGVWKLCSSL